MKYFNCLVIALFVFVNTTSCKLDSKKQNAVNDEQELITDNIIDVTAKDFTFTVADSIPSGWSTFRMKNTGMMEHFFFLTKLPDSIKFEDYINGVGKAFGMAWNAYKNGDVDKGGAYGILGENLPDWYANAKAMGGIGIISGGQTGITTLKLEPGNYVMECYIKTAEGQFHSELGMINPITVIDESTKMLAPKANVDITLNNESMEVTGNLIRGNNTIAVHFNEHPEVGLGNDIHLIKTDKNIDFEAVTQWMDWLNIGGMTSPGPAIFLGGAHEMPVGFTAFFQCELEPGEYALVAETPIGRIKKLSVE